MIGTAAMAAAPPEGQRAGEQHLGVDAVGQPAAQPGAEGDAGEHDADDAR